MLSSANAASLTSVPSGLEESWVSAVSLTRRMPPRYIDRTVAGITHLCPRLRGEILTRVERKLKLCFDPEARRYFVACPYNQHGAAYRSPWTNKYIQAQGDTRDVSPTPPPPALRRFKPADHLRRVECAYNQIFDAYRHTYYEGGVSSVYVWSLPSEDGFAAAFVIHHALDGGASGEGPRGCWDSIHVVEVIQSTSNVYYRLTSTVILDIYPPRNTSPAKFYAGTMLTRTSELSQKVVDLRSSPDTPPHIGVIGPMIEQMEEGMRTSIERMYLAKAYAIVDGMLRSDRNTTGVETAAVFYELNSSLSALVGAGVPAAAAGRPSVGRASIVTSAAQDLPSRIRSMVKEKEGSLKSSENLQKNDSV